jgi:fructose transport system substrate-binding protein
MESCLSKNKDINTVYTINEPTAAGAVEALQAAGIKDAVVVSVDGGCSPASRWLRTAPSGQLSSSTQ